MAAIVAIGFGSVALVAQSPPAPPKLVRVDRAGTASVLGTLPLNAFAVRISPDGRRIVYDTGDNTIWIADLNSLGSPRRLAAGRFPLWSADGARVLFIVANSEGVQQLFWQAADGSDMPQLLVAAARAPESWFPDGDRFTYITLKNSGDYDIWSFSLRDRAPKALVALEGTPQLSSRVSPDGRWIAYQQTESDGDQIYVEPLPANGERTKITAGQRPVWTPDGRELYFDLDGALHVVSIQTSPRVIAGVPRRLPIAGFIQGFGRRTYDLTPDGRYFLVLTR
jgi:eukaryotic-like serine/threonine-protein kinase